ncbi:hypothetical protein HWV62_12062 [Athelia sp. TMB]|nr:hypothetical protein HWV62_12062 [Athelia sp. TMB]
MPRAAAQELSDEMTSDPLEVASDAETMDDDLPVLSADALLKDFTIPFFYQEETRDAVLNCGSLQVNKLKTQALCAQDEFRQSLAITHNLQLKASRLRQEYFDSVAEYNYFRLAFGEYHLDVAPNAPDDKLAVRPPQECDDNRVRVYQSEVPRAIRRLPNARAFAKQSLGGHKYKLTLHRGSRLYFFQGQRGTPSASTSGA